MIDCARCGQRVPRLTATQRRCPKCEGEVQAIVAADARRRTARFAPKDLTGALR